ncbi:MAG: ATP-binding cassette domain-containing protein [Thiotrichales bacterium]|nr:MAG: ATP-binding cassette domain-containing protein [Thiotrichales bacterium]
MGAQANRDLLLSAEDLAYTVRGHSILESVSLKLHQDEIVTLIGPNGAGKTSLVRILLGLKRATNGQVYTRPGLKIGYVPQRLHIDPVLPLRVRDFLLTAGRFNDPQLLRVLEEVRMPHLLTSALQTLSGGEFQRILLARALLHQPDVLVLDEPAQGVDIIGQQALYQTIKQIRDRHACGVLMVSHDLHLVMASADQVICLNKHICCTGHPDDVSAHPEYLKIFGQAMEGLAPYSHHHDHSHDAHGNVVPLRGDKEAELHDR